MTIYIAAYRRQVALQSSQKSVKCDHMSINHMKPKTRMSLNVFLKTARESADVAEAGRLFHKSGPATPKDRYPAAVIERGTDRRPKLFDRKRRLEAADGGRM